MHVRKVRDGKAAQGTPVHSNTICVVSRGIASPIQIWLDMDIKEKTDQGSNTGKIAFVRS